MAYAILRFSKRKAGGVAGADRHNERKKQSYKSNPDIDIGRIKDNYHLIKPQGTYKAEYTKRIQEAGCRTRSDSVVMVETLITASPEFMKELSKEKQKEFFTHALGFISREVGQQNIISAVVHMDETTPHMHLSFCPITEDNRLSAKQIIGDRRRLEKWQDDFHAHMVQKYPTLQRGIPASISHRKHIPSYLFKQASELETAHELIVKAVKDIGILNAGKKRDEALAVLERYIPVMSKFSAQIQRTDKYIKELEQTTSQMRSAIEHKNEKLNDMHSQIFALEYQVKNLNHEQKKTKDLLAKIPPEIVQQFCKKKNKEYSR